MNIYLFSNDETALLMHENGKAFARMGFRLAVYRLEEYYTQLAENAPVSKEQYMLTLTSPQGSTFAVTAGCRADLYRHGLQAASMARPLGLVAT